MNTEMQDPKGRCETAARIIRKRSRAGQLTSAEDILDEPDGAAEKETGQGGQGDALEDFLEVMMEENKDIREILGRKDTPHYYSVMHMTERYAEILMKKGDDPVRLIAELVRENAAQYPSPTPVDVLKGPPFDMTQEEIGVCLRNMAAWEGYEDIERLSSSAGTPFLYSTLHLETDHAAMLAEWIDVGQFENP